MADTNSSGTFGSWLPSTDTVGKFATGAQWVAGMGQAYFGMNIWSNYVRAPTNRLPNIRAKLDWVNAQTARAAFREIGASTESYAISANAALGRGLRGCR